MKRIHVALVALIVIATPALAGCWNGKDATTQTQATMNSGNGVVAVAGAIHIANATLVMGPDGTKTATLTARVVNAGLAADQLLGVRINDKDAYVTDAPIDLPAGVSISFGYDSEHWINAYDLDVPLSNYVPVRFTFRDAGFVDMSLLTVPPVGYYEGIAPNPPTAP